ncbi:electron transfer flavoprotein subunit beta/FixA family protein [Paenarthrobacter sp. CM16]|uniref:electron transfer flavoprotein subunit beta/FixA family protein n=1 Tax=Paenarthrobacter sp. CM16 TaxID=2738447 RepID=UPI001555211E|nr:electron transfer flavoprotein subunit beta/FixA family protein [Paenarthrobacter sp. CM16]NQD86868.1 electron transfer flavoprotein subunit beta/FixA family protein [Paenarthrobacter sp. CM16]
MKIIVLVKEVPDTYGDRKLDLETGLAERSAGEVVLDEIGERSLEVALSFADKNANTEMVVLSMAPESATATLRRALAMGATSAVHVADGGLSGADLGLTAEVLAAAIQRTGFDLVIAGDLSTDGTGGVLAAMVAELLSVPHATSLSSIEIDSEIVTGIRVTEDGTMQLSAPLPAVVSITEALPDARLPNFKGIMAAKKKTFETFSLADLGVDPDASESARSIVIAVAEKPARGPGLKIIDEGDAGDKLADFLLQNRLV